VDRIQAVCFAAVTGLLGDQTGSDDFTVEAIVLEASLQDVSCTGGLVATAGSALFAQSPKHSTHGVEITGKALDSRFGIIAEQNGGSDGILVNIHPHPNGIGAIMCHGWAPLRERER